MRKDAEILAFQTMEIYENITCRLKSNRTIAITRACVNFTCTCDSLTPGSFYSIELTNKKPSYIEVFYLNSLDLAKEYQTSTIYFILIYNN